MKKIKESAMKFSLFFIFAMSIAAVIIGSLQVFEDISISNEKYYAADSARLQIDRMKLEQNPYFANLLASKSMNELIRNLNNTVGVKDLNKSLEKYQEYILQRGSIDTINKAINDLKKNATSLHVQIQKEGFRAASETAPLLDAINTFKASRLADSLGLIKNSQTTVSLLTDRFLNVKIDVGTKTSIVNYLNGMTKKLEYLGKRAAYLDSRRDVVTDFTLTMRSMREHLADYQTLMQSKSRIASDEIKNLLLYTWAMGGLLLFSLFRFWASGKTEKVVYKEIIKEVPQIMVADAETDKNKMLVESLQMGMTAPTVILDSSEKIVWASDSFFKTLNASFDRTRDFYWGDFVNSKLIVQGGALRVNGSVRLITDPEKEYQMKTNLVLSSKSEYRVIQFVPLMNYQIEVSKTMKDLERFKNIKLPKLHDMGDVLEEVITKGQAIFENSKTQLVFNNDKPMFVAFEKEKLVKMLTTLLSGIIFHFETQFGRHRVEISFDKDGEDTVIRFKIPDSKVEDVNNPTFFKGKTYPSLSSYLAQIEDALKEVKAAVTVKNITSQKSGKSFGLIELSLKELQEDYLDTKNLENKERVARAVSKAEKIKKRLAFKDFQ